MLKHGLSLRRGFLTFNNQVFKAVITPTKYIKSSVNIKDLKLRHNYASYHQRSWYSSIAAAPNPSGTGTDENPESSICDSTTIVKKRGNKEEIGDTLKEMVVEKTKADDTEVRSDPKYGNKWQSVEGNKNRDRPRRSVKSNRNSDGDEGNDDEAPLLHSQKWIDRDLEENPRKGKTWTNEQERLLYEVIETGGTLSSGEWGTVREKVLAAGNFINNLNIDASVMGICITFKNLAAGKSFLSYLTTSDQEPNVASIAKFLKLCYLCSSEINESIQTEILSMYDALRAKHPVLDAGTAENVIHGISVTNRWKEGLELLEEIRLTCSPNTSTYSALVQAAFDNDEPEIGWELVSKMMVDNRKPSLSVYESWLKYSHRASAGNIEAEQKLVERMLYFFANNDIRLSEDTVRLVRHWYEYSAPFEDNWDVEYTTVDQRGQCNTCRRYLSPLAIGEQEFESLRSAFLDKALVGSNVFLKSTPEELEEFRAFVKKTAPYDVVIDGLNVGYSAGAAGKGNPRTYSRMLQSVVQHFVRKNQKVLVLGRRHMYNWPRESMDYVYENAEVFLAENLSQDDPFLLYAAMFSGLGTCFISRDLMRSHLFLLKDQKLQSSFRRWQKQHQYQILYIEPGGNVRMRTPLKFNTATQRGRNGAWHVPYDLDKASSRVQALHPPFQWLCMKKNIERDYDNVGEDREFKPRFQERNDRQMNKPNHSFRSRQSESALDDLSEDDEKPLVPFKSQRRGAQQKFDGGSKSRQLDSAFDDLSEEDEKPLVSFKSQQRGPQQKFDGGSRSRQLDSALDDLSEEDEKPLVSFKQQRRPPQKQFDDGSESDDFGLPKKNSRYQRKPTRKTDDWDV